MQSNMNRRHANAAASSALIAVFLALFIAPPTGGAAEKRKAPEPPLLTALGWTNLFDGKTLKGWKASDFAGSGEVAVEGGRIVMNMGNDMTGITWTNEPLRIDYEVALEAMRVDGSDFFCALTFPVKKDPCSLVVGGWGGGVAGLSSIDGYDAANNNTTTYHSFKDKQWYLIRLRVTAERIQAWIDDEQIVDQELAEHEVSIRFEVEPCRPFGIATWRTTGAVRNIQWRSIQPAPATSK